MREVVPGPRRWLLFGWLLGVGCDVDVAYDSDEDGWLDVQDCDAGDSSVFPGADDRWGDGIDTNCDGRDGVDLDQDGFSAGSTGISGADRPDCNDGDPGTHPDAPELEDGEDNDCDGLIDEGGSHSDDDGDGFCEDGSSCAGGALPGDCDDADPALQPGDRDGDGISTCAPVPDCDDANAARAPGLAEACDGLDNDCDGLLPTWDGDEDGDGQAPCAGDCDDGEAGASGLLGVLWEGAEQASRRHFRS